MSEITVVEYLYKRLHQLGVRSVHGVPGDFNLVALDYIPNAGLKWVGNCNELNAAYAAVWSPFNSDIFRVSILISNELHRTGTPESRDYQL